VPLLLKEVSMHVSEKLLVLQTALMIGGVEDVHENVMIVLDIISTPALWPPRELREPVAPQEYRA
jgi:hypothetical protein